VYKPQLEHAPKPLIEGLDEKQERMFALLGGTTLMTFALLRRGGLGVPAFLAGLVLLIRALKNPVEEFIEQRTHNENVRTSRNVSVPHETGIHVVRSVTINRPVEELYSFWRDPNNLERILKYVDSVQMIGDNRATWTLKLPGGGTTQFNAELYTDTPNEVISWRSLEGADVKNAWSVRFRPAPSGRGTEIHLTVEFTPPGGALGRAVTNLFGEVPGQYFAQYLREFKQLMETGEKTTNAGPSGRQKETSE
jgi:uncharacterized membrane protein